MSKKEEKVYMVDFVIRHLWHKMSRMYNQRANDYGVSISVGFILLNVDQEGTPSTQLGPKMGMESRSLTRTLKNLEDEKVIYRQADKNDKRMVRIFLTELGIEKRNLSKEKVIKFNTHLMNNIKKKDLAVFFKVMGGINELIDENNIF